MSMSARFHAWEPSTQTQLGTKVAINSAENATGARGHPTLGTGQRWQPITKEAGIQFDVLKNYSQ